MVPLCITQYPVTLTGSSPFGGVISAFLKLLTTFNKGVASHNSVLSEVAALFRGHADLLMEFTCFIPITEQQQVRNHHTAFT